MKVDGKKKIMILAFACVAIFCAIVDLVSKQFVVGINKPVVRGLLRFQYVENTGAGWSIFSGSTIELAIISIFAVVALVFYVVFSKTNNVLFHVSIGLIVGGALGNFFERVILGYVRDFIKLEFINFPTFNIADSFLTIGVVLYCLYFLINAIKEARSKKKKND